MQEGNKQSLLAQLTRKHWAAITSLAQALSVPAPGSSASSPGSSPPPVDNPHTEAADAVADAVASTAAVSAMSPAPAPRPPRSASEDAGLHCRRPNPAVDLGGSLATRY
jgi:hypothetical protein